MKKIILNLLLLLCVCCTVDAQQKFDAHQLLTDIKTLSSDEFEGRKTGSQGSLLAQEYIIERFVDYHLLPFNGSYNQKFTFQSKGKEVNGNNIIAHLPGRRKDAKFILIYGHYDHLGVVDGEIYNGADDNASGLAGMFAVADYYTKHKPGHHLVFIAFDAEEWGLKGAAYFAENMPMKKEDVVASINMDMISRNDKNQLYACGTYHYPFLKPVLEEAASKAKIEIVFGHDKPGEAEDWTYASDHGMLHKQGVPFVYFGVEDHKDYHRPTDVFETINQVFFINAVDFIIDVVAGFDKNLDAMAEELKKLRKKKQK